MRPLRLSLSGFGPFLENQVVDLRGFRYSRLFLIHGPVGSGKTFLLDGICFALYGRSSGGERDRQGLRSLGAPPGTDTVVELDFEVASENYRVERRLVLTSEPGVFGPDEVTLWRLPSFGDPSRRDILASTLSGVESMLTRMLGLSAEQFCQVAILPQGQFRRFLLAPPQERTAIIGRMFDGQLYQRFSALLAEAHESLKQQVNEAWKEREAVTSRYKDTLGDPRERLWRSQEELKAVSAECAAHQTKSQEWERSLESAVRYETLERQKEMSQRELDELTHQGESPADALSRRLKEALPDFLRWRECHAEIEEIIRELDEQRTHYDKLKRETNFLEEEVELARRHEEEKYSLLRAGERLEEVWQEAEGLSTLEAELEAAEDRLAELGRTRSVLAQEVKRTQARAQKLEAELERTAKAELRLSGLRQEVAALEARDQETRQKSHLLATVEQARQREARLRETISNLQGELATAQERWYSQRAHSRAEALSLLRGELTSGKECPLCGAKRHPKPYDGRLDAQGPVGDELEQRVLALKARLDHASSELAQVEERRARFEGRLDGLGKVSAQVEDVSALIEGLRNSIALIESKLSQRQSHREELQRIERELVPNRKKLRQMRLMKERLEATIESAGVSAESRRQRIGEMLRESLGQEVSLDTEGWLELLHQEKARLAERLEVLRSTTYGSERAELMAETFALGLAETRAAEKRRDSLQHEAEDLQAALLEAFRIDFASWTDLQFALGREAREFRVARGEDSVLDKETLVRAVQRQLDQTQELLAAVPSPEMRSEQIRHALNREREQIELKTGRRVSLERAVEQGVQDVELYDEVVERIRELEAKMQAIGPLAAEVSGNNKAGVAFPDWVLDRCFARVISAANLKLELLAPQRFTLLQDRGLEVKVFDIAAGTTRSATTLSGGESFLASLALALGLGEVLQGSQGAADRLGTLFIDEGFGYLDQQALDAALQCLENLRGEGRTIGLVSHVVELRERIRAQIVVVGREDAEAGSRIRVYSV